MSHTEHESIEPILDQHTLERSVHQLGLLYGISGLEIVVEPGAGTSCARLEHGLRVTVDPTQIVEGDGHGMDSLEYGSTSPEVNALFMTGHELGHALDFLDPAFRKSATSDNNRDFFDCLIDDTVIDKRSRRIPLFDAKADAVYAHQIPRDLSELPKHAQLMYGVRVGQVMKKDPQLVMDPEVEAILGQITHYERDGEVFDIPAVLADPRTSFSERRRIANTFILPHYEALLEQDKQNSKDGEGDGTFEKAHNQYQEAVHGHRHDGDQEEGADGNHDQDKSQPKAGEGKPGANGESDAQTGDLATQLAGVIKQISLEQQAKNAAKANQAKTQAAAQGQGDEKEREAQLSELAGTVAAEMNLSPGNAESYVRSLDEWAPTVKQVSDVFMQLAAPADTIMSPRYRREARTEGVRLHPRTMAGIALQLETEQDQSIWQPVERKAHRQDVTFGGLDVHLLVDVSVSMRGPKAQCAADTALCLIEGLQLARHKVSREAGQSHQPDVRTQVIAFGSGTEVLSPLAHEPSGPQKGKTYVNLLNPNSGATLVSGSLDLVRQAASQKPKRDVIAIIISDGHFGDHNKAAQAVAELPKSAYVAHLVIGNNATEFISDNHEGVANPNDLPSKLHGVLADYINRIK